MRNRSNRNEFLLLSSETVLSLTDTNDIVCCLLLVIVSIAEVDNIFLPFFPLLPHYKMLTSNKTNLDHTIQFRMFLRVRKTELLGNWCRYCAQSECVSTTKMKIHSKTSILISKFLLWSASLMWEKHKISGKYGRNWKAINLTRCDAMRTWLGKSKNAKRIISRYRKRKASPLHYVILTTSSIYAMAMAIDIYVRCMWSEWDTTSNTQTHTDFNFMVETVSGSTFTIEHACVEVISNSGGY